MTIAEFFIKLGVKVEGADKIKGTQKDLKTTAEVGTAAAKKLDEQAEQKKKSDEKVEKSEEKRKDAAAASDKKTKDAAKGLKEMAIWATATAAAIDAVSGSLFFMVNGALQAFQGMQRLTAATGLPLEGILRAQAEGARAGVNPEEMAGFVASLQSAGAKMQLTGEGVGPWTLLSKMLGQTLDPRQDPIALVDKLHAGLMKLRPDQLGIARQVAGQAGISENMFAAMRNPEFNASRFNPQTQVNQKDLEAMNRLNAEWASLLINIDSAKNKLVASFAPAMEQAVKVISVVVGWLGDFVAWLDKGGVAADTVKTAIVLFTTALLAASVALTAFAIYAGVAALATTSLATGIGVLSGLSLLVLVGQFGLLAAAIVGAAGAVTKLISLIMDIKRINAMGAASGKQADAMEHKEAIERRARGIAPKTEREKLIDRELDETPDQRMRRELSLPARHRPPGLTSTFDSSTIAAQPSIVQMAAKNAAQNPSSGTSSSTSNTTIHQQVTIPISGAGDPKATAQEVRGVLRDQLNQAAYSAPANQR
jgi:hypothetical protein